MYKHYPVPTIIGTGVTGLLISLNLSRERIAHRLIGGPPPTGGPRLGESLLVEATVEFLDRFPELAACYHPKEFARVYSGQHHVVCDLRVNKVLPFRLAFNLLRRAAPDALLHLDRISFDAALHEKATQNPYCTYLQALVADVSYDPESDKVSHIQLEDGTSLPVSYLFDATNFRRFLARQLQIPIQPLGEPQRTIYTHYLRNSSSDNSPNSSLINFPDCPSASSPTTTPKTATWMNGTHILRLYQEPDGFNGLAWCIPLGDTVSVGLSTPMGEPERAESTCLDTVKEKFAQNGVTFKDTHSEETRFAHASIEFYTHNRAYGANWLLCAAAHSQVWWPTAAGLDSSCAAARAAVSFIKKPQQTGEIYQDYMKSVVQANRSWNNLTSDHKRTPARHQLAYFANRIAWAASLRWLNSLRFDGQEMPLRIFGHTASHIWANELWTYSPSLFCTVRKTKINETST